VRDGDAPDRERINCVRASKDQVEDDRTYEQRRSTSADNEERRTVRTLLAANAAHKRKQAKHAAMPAANPATTQNTAVADI
jgi:Spy/CpxP family protein refolding chaperone